MRKKSHLVLRMLEQRIGQELLLQVFNKQLSLASNAANTRIGAGLWGQLLLSTNLFVKAIFTVTGKDMAVFVDQWVRSGGHARFTLSSVFNRKRWELCIHVSPMLQSLLNNGCLHSYRSWFITSPFHYN